MLVWDWATMNVSDQQFHPVVERVNGQSIGLANGGFRSVEGHPGNRKLGTQSAPGMSVCGSKQRRAWRASGGPSIQTRLRSGGYVHVLLTLFHQCILMPTLSILMSSRDERVPKMKREPLFILFFYTVYI